MAKISADNAIEDFFIPMRDGTLLILRKIAGGKKRAVLILPGHGQHHATSLISELARSLPDALTSVFVLELRGHGRSEGRWSQQALAGDIAKILELLHASYKSVYVVAFGACALTMIEREHKEALLHGMVLLMSHNDTIAPVRFQTPTRIFVTGHNEPLLRRIFGPVRVCATWTQHASGAELSHRIQQLQSALNELYLAEKPIRFVH